METSELISTGTALFRRNFKVVITAAVLPRLAMVAMLFAIGQVVRYVWLSEPYDPVTVWAEMAFGWKALVILAWMLTTYVPTAIAHVGIARAAFDSVTGQKPSLRTVLDAMLKVLPIGLPFFSIVGWLWMAAWVVVFVPGLLLTPFVALLPVAMSLEGAGPLRALSVAKVVGTRRFSVTLAAWVLGCFAAMGLTIFNPPLILAGVAGRLGFFAGIILLLSIAAVVDGWLGCVTSVIYLDVKPLGSAQAAAARVAV